MSGQPGDAPASVMEAVGSHPCVCTMPSFTPEVAQTVADFEARRGDVMIVTYPKCGTTWTQQLCHQIRTGGHVDFDEISEERIVPWLEQGPSMGIDISLPQMAEPRCFKTHQMLRSLSYLEARGAKYLCILRDPEATLISQFKFMLSKNRPGTESKNVNDFATYTFLPTLAGGSGEKLPTFGGYLWEFYAEFWRCRTLPNVKLLPFEHLKRDLGSQIPLIAEFMGIVEMTPEHHAKVVELSSFAWMQANDHLFDDHHVGVRMAKIKGKGKGKGEKEGKGRGEGEGSEEGNGKGKGEEEEEKRVTTCSKVGLQVGADVNTTVTEETRAMLAQAWREMVTPVTGHETYQAMIDELEQSRS